VTGLAGRQAPPSYLSRMLAELDLLEQDYADVL